MKSDGVLIHLRRTWGYAACAVALCALSLTLGRPASQASASTPSALELADHAITSSSLLADESPYELIDPVGPGGATEDQAKGEVLSSTMIGGIYNDNSHYGGGYFDGLYYEQVRQSYTSHGYRSGYRATPQLWGGHR